MIYIAPLTNASNGQLLQTSGHDCKIWPTSFIRNNYQKPFCFINFTKILTLHLALPRQEEYCPLSFVFLVNSENTRYKSSITSCFHLVQHNFIIITLRQTFFSFTMYLQYVFRYWFIAGSIWFGSIGFWPMKLSEDHSLNQVWISILDEVCGFKMWVNFS